jgi:hypothetical protein
MYKLRVRQTRYRFFYFTIRSDAAFALWQFSSMQGTLWDFMLCREGIKNLDLRQTEKERKGNGFLGFYLILCERKKEKKGWR